jgi:hypothetical protein
MAKLPEPEIDIKEKVYQLYYELLEAEHDKKESNKAHSENIKRIKDELKEAIETEQEALASVQKEVAD